MLTCVILFARTEAFLALQRHHLHVQIWRLRDRDWFGQTLQQRREQKNLGFLTFDQKSKVVPGVCWLSATSLTPIETMNIRERLEFI